jgi:hypothetical protein
MRKAILFLSVVLILLATAGPLLTGRLAERQFRDGVALLAASPEAAQLGLQPIQESYERGWFSTVSATRVVVLEGPVMRLLQRYIGNAEFADEPAFLVRNVIHHGPLTGLLKPALARIESAVFVDGLAPGPAQVPLQLETLIGLGGGTAVRWQIADGNVRGEARGAAWLGARGSADFTNRGALDGFSIDAAELSIGDDGRHMLLTMNEAALTGDLDEQTAASGLPTGRYTLTAASGLLASVVSPDEAAGGSPAGAPLLEFRDARISSEASIRDSMLDTTIDLDMPVLSGNEGTSISLDGLIAIGGLDAGAVRALQAAASERAVRESRLQFELGAPPAEDDPRLVAIRTDYTTRTAPALRTLIARGGESAWDVTIGTPDGDLDLDLFIEVPATSVATTMPPRDAVAAALQQASGKIRLVVPQSVVDNTIASNPAAKQQFDALRGMGFVLKEADAYVMDALYDDGMLSLNGVPMPLSPPATP